MTRALLLAILAFSINAAFLTPRIRADAASPLPSLLHYRSFLPYTNGGTYDELTFSSAAGFEFNVYQDDGPGILSFYPSPSPGSNLQGGAPQIAFAMTNGRLIPGSYTSTSVSTGFDCSELTDATGTVASSWQIIQADYAPGGTLLHAAVNFEVLDTQGKVQVRGELRYHSALPPRGEVELAADAYLGNKSSSGVTVTINREGDVSAPITVKYATADYSAVSNVDYAPLHGKLKWPAGDASPRTIFIPILHDPASGDRVLFVKLKGSNVGDLTETTVTITDDGQTPAANRPEPDGSLDTSYGLGLSNSTQVVLGAIEPDADGRVLVGGNFTGASGRGQPGILRTTIAGSLDTTFDSPFSPANNPSVDAIAIQPDGKVLAAGIFTLAGSGKFASIVRLNEDGTLDPGFNAPGFVTPIVYAMALQPDGRVLLTKEYGMGDCVVRLEADGSVDPTFNAPYPSIEGGFLALQPDGQIIVSDGSAMVVRLNADGSEDHVYFLQYSSLGDSPANAVALQPDGKLIVPTGIYGTGLARFNHDGTLDDDFALDASLVGKIASVEALAVQPDGKLLVGLKPAGSGADALPGLLRLNSDGSLDQSFKLASGLPAIVDALALEPDGSLLISAGSETNSQNGVVHTVFARLAAVAPAADTPIVTVTADPSVAKKSTLQAGQVVLGRTGDLTRPLKVKYTVKGDAVAGTDYVALTGQQKFGAGESTAGIAIEPLAGALGRGTMKLKVEIEPTARYNLGTPSRAKVKIID